MLPNNRFKWTAFTKECAGVSLFLFFWRGGGGGGGEWGGDYFPRSRFIKAIISIHMYIVGRTSVTLRSTRLPSFSF